jgi:hypothetical protein
MRALFIMDMLSPLKTTIKTQTFNHSYTRSHTHTLAKLYEHATIKNITTNLWNTKQHINAIHY